MVFIDFSKAFDSINHLAYSTRSVNWLAGFSFFGKISEIVANISDLMCPFWQPNVFVSDTLA